MHADTGRPRAVSFMACICTLLFLWRCLGKSCAVAYSREVHSCCVLGELLGFVWIITPWLEQEMELGHFRAVLVWIGLGGRRTALVLSPTPLSDIRNFITPQKISICTEGAQEDSLVSDYKWIQISFNLRQFIEPLSKSLSQHSVDKERIKILK